MEEEGDFVVRKGQKKGSVSYPCMTSAQKREVEFEMKCVDGLRHSVGSGGA
jgi:hypothetical protein